MVLLRSQAFNLLIIQDGFTALHLASSKGHVKVVKVLLLAGVDVDTKTDVSVIFSDYFYLQLALARLYLFYNLTYLIVH